MKYTLRKHYLRIINLELIFNNLKSIAFVLISYVQILDNVLVDKLCSVPYLNNYVFLIVFNMHASVLITYIIMLLTLNH